MCSRPPGVSCHPHSEDAARGGEAYSTSSVLKVNVNVPPNANCLAVDYRFLFGTGHHEEAPCLIRSVKVVAKKAGKVELTFRLTKAGKKVLKKKKGKLSAKVKITFKPTGGTAKSTFKRITIKRKAKR